MSEHLTDRAFWKAHWAHYTCKQVPTKVFFQEYIPNQIEQKSFIEIGGFPGTYSIFFHNRHRCNASLLDFYIDKEIVNCMETLNGIKTNTISCIESDFFAFQPTEKYDMVFSNGFIEHFDDTQEIIKRHIDLLAPKGNLLIMLPNFLGINGWIQKKFDKENLAVHNLKSMEIKRLKEILASFDLDNAKVEYSKKPMLWLEPKPTRSNNIARKVIKLASLLLKLMPIRSKLISPHIVITATQKGY